MKRLECNACGSRPERWGLFKGDEKPGDQCPCCFLDDYDCDGTLVEISPPQSGCCDECLFYDQDWAECRVNFPADWGHYPPKTPACASFKDASKYCITRFPDGVPKLWDREAGGPVK